MKNHFIYRASIETQTETLNKLLEELKANIRIAVDFAPEYGGWRLNVYDATDKNKAKPKIHALYNYTRLSSKEMLRYLIGIYVGARTFTNYYGDFYKKRI